MLTTIVLAGALLATPQAEKWDIKAGLAPKATGKWSVSTDVTAGGENHTATMKLVMTVKDAEADKPLKATYEWKDLTVDGSMQIPDDAWDVTLDAMGGITDATGGDGADSVRQMLMPTVFIYPDKPVGVGDTWTDTLKVNGKDDQAMTFEMKADAIEKIGDADVLKVSGSIAQKGADGLNGKSTWWISKEGKVLKFESKVSGWIVPMAGQDPMDATFKGELEK